MKYQPKFYRAHVASGNDSAHLVAVTYWHDTGERNAGVEFFELVWSRDVVHVLPSGRNATLAEELLACHNAAAVLSGTRSEERSALCALLREIYGHAVDVQLAEFDPLSRMQVK